MKAWIGVGIMCLGLATFSGCSRQDSDRARSEGRDAQEKAQRQLEVTRDKVREDLKRADQQTREDLNKARDQVRQALSQSERDAEKARDRLREREKNPDSPDDSHQ